jgi:hypothetical protein
MLQYSLELAALQKEPQTITTLCIHNHQPTYTATQTVLSTLPHSQSFKCYIPKPNIILLQVELYNVLLLAFKTHKIVMNTVGS